MSDVKKAETAKPVDKPASDTPKADSPARAEAKSTPAKPAKKTMTDSQKLKALVEAAKANGWSLPDEIHDDE